MTLEWQLLVQKVEKLKQKLPWTVPQLERLQNFLEWVFNSFYSPVKNEDVYIFAES
jgi:hypothetical protein